MKVKVKKTRAERKQHSRDMQAKHIDGFYAGTAEISVTPVLVLQLVHPSP